MAGMIILLALALVSTLHHTSADMELEDLNDDSYTRARGSDTQCPETIRFLTESQVIQANRIRVNKESDCQGLAFIPLIPIDSPQSSSSNPVNYFSSRNDEVERFFVGRNTEDMTCGPYTFGAGLEWVFFRPDDELDDVRWSDIYGTTPSFAKEAEEVDFEEEERYLLIGDSCFYQDSGITDGALPPDSAPSDDSDAVPPDSTPIATDNDSFPDSSPISDSSSTDNVCFPADASVQLENGSVKTMDKLSIGDRVQVGHGIYSDIFAWTHKTSDNKYKFVQPTTEDGNKICATGSHYIYADGQSIQMKRVRVGMSLRLENGSATGVVKKERVLKTGLYNPQTVAGDIVVNGIMTTTYTAAVQPEAAHALLAPVRAAYQAFKGLLLEQAKEI